MALYMPADGLKYEMEKRWSERSADQFPTSKTDLIETFRYIEGLLNREYHDYIGLGASIAGDGVLTDHGVKHVQSVIDKAWLIIKHKNNQLNGYELYLLLLSIHFHDIGNIVGREEHEQKIIDIMNKVEDKLPLDAAEQEYITTIAMSHGGHVQGDKSNKDTLGTLAERTTCNGIEIKPKILAAVLRFADELADDYDRIIPNIEIPADNEAYHEYSKSLEPIGFNGKTLSFRYRIDYEKAKFPVKLSGCDILLYDYILDRLAKCLRELDYCRRCSGGLIDIEDISVDIKVKNQWHSPKAIYHNSFRLSLAGYPKVEAYRLTDYIIVEQKQFNDQSITSKKIINGDELKNELIKNEKVENAHA